jgi:hypothetical protein
MSVSSIILDKHVSYADIEKELITLFPKLSFRETEDEEYAPNGEYISLSVTYTGRTFDTQIIFWDFPGEITGEREIFIARKLCHAFNAAAIVEAEIDDEDYDDDSAVFVYDNKLYKIDTSDIEDDDYIPSPEWEIVIDIRKYDEEGLPVEVPRGKKK